MEIIKKSAQGRKPRTTDIVITVSMRKTCVVSFTDDARNKLFSHRIMFGFEKGRMYLIECESDEDGFKLVKPKSRNMWIVTGGRKLASKLYKYRGSYNLKYDANKKSYYITLKEKEK